MKRRSKTNLPESRGPRNGFGEVSTGRRDLWESCCPQYDLLADRRGSECCPHRPRLCGGRGACGGQALEQLGPLLTSFLLGASLALGSYPLYYSQSTTILLPAHRPGGQSSIAQVASIQPSIARPSSALQRSSALANQPAILDHCRRRRLGRDHRWRIRGHGYLHRRRLYCWWHLR